MIRQVMSIVGAMVLSAGMAQGDSDLATALDAVRAEDYVGARAAMDRVEDAAARDVVQWALLRASQGSFADTLRFLDRRGDWPGLPLLRKRQEQNIPAGAEAETVVRFFAPQAPRTPQGAIRFGEALAALEERDAGRAAIIKAWLTMPMSDADHQEFQTRFGGFLAPHHGARLNAMVWTGNATSAQRMFPLVSEAEAAEARARIALRAEANGVDGLIEAVPAALRTSPGMEYERFRWRLSKGRTGGALEILLPASASAERLGRPEVWARHRGSLARRLMREGRGQEAYRVAANHHLPDASDAAQLEWLAGYISLRKLGDARTALRHFQRFEQGVGTPISLGRAGYWLGRAHEALGDSAAARQAYTRGARYQTSFYGQLSAERAGVAPDPRLAGTETFPDFRQSSFAQSSVLRAALVLHSAGEEWLTERFMTHLAESLTRSEIGSLIEVALAIEEPHVAVMIGKRAAQAGHELHKGYYAVMPELSNLRTPVAPELVLSIGRRESEFDPGVISHAGARGLLQLMPRTAQAMAAKTGQPYSSDRLLADPLYNATLGAAYLAQLEEEFGPNAILVSAGYNAGPSRARRWLEQFGNPASSRVDVVDWIEHVPFNETRNYIMRVSESLAIYRARLSGQVGPLGLEQALRRR